MNTIPEGWKLVPVEPTPQIIAGAASAVWPTASKADIDLARKAAPIVLMTFDLGPGFTVETLAAALATMAPAYRAMIAAAPQPPAAPRQPLTRDQVKALLGSAGYDSDAMQERVDFINGLRHGERAHGIGLEGGAA